LQADREVRRGKGGVDDIDCALNTRSMSGAVGVDVELDLAAGAEVGIEELRDVEVE